MSQYWPLVVGICIKMDKKPGIGFPYTPSIGRDMKMFYGSLNEKDKRHYAALEAR